MESTEELFQELIEKTVELLQVVMISEQTDDIAAVNHLFEERELLLKRLDSNLHHTENANQYRSLYESWQMKEMELMNFVKSSLYNLDKKITETQNARTISTQYDSYLRQMPYGAFLDKKR
ncbi:hypothetical protein M5X11_09005 [Paenibacillus alginolyticus]|uniref:hypothetical protein n=1 Tax=Paenibacillus alginolyticus TaxID=59839 RepID=UPI00041B8E52|nr:hypothetical protein [Paenibacillus alginolyticus]MCY9665095.1 hypothetical protein [Paenibacillus alginolyticus]